MLYGADVEELFTEFSVKSAFFSAYCLENISEFGTE